MKRGGRKGGRGRSWKLRGCEGWGGREIEQEGARHSGLFD